MRLAFVFVGTFLFACSNDTFSGQDAATDASTDAPSSEAAPPIEGGSGDAIASDGGDLRFCLKHVGSLFCDDFDAVADVHPWSLWTSSTPSAPTTLLSFVAGTAGQGVQAKPGLNATAFLTKSTDTPPTSISFDMKLPNGTILSSTYVRVTSNTNKLTLGAPAVSNQLALTGSDNTPHAFNADASWHNYKLELGTSSVTLLEDGTSQATATYPAPQAVTLDIGYVAGGTGGTVQFDNVLIE